MCIIASEAETETAEDEPGTGARALDEGEAGKDETGTAGADKVEKGAGKTAAAPTSLAVQSDIFDVVPKKAAANDGNNVQEGMVCCKCWDKAVIAPCGTRYAQGWAQSGKNSGTLKCPSCNAVCTKFQREHLSLKCFEGFSGNVVAEWFRSLAKTKGAIRSTVEMMLITENRKTDFDQAKGDWLPAGVYIANGWPKEVCDKCEEVWDHPQLGRLIRLEIVSSGKRQEASTTEREVLSRVEKAPKPAKEQKEKKEATIKDSALKVWLRGAGPGPEAVAEVAALKEFTSRHAVDLRNGLQAQADEQTFRENVPPIVMAELEKTKEDLLEVAGVTTAAEFKEKFPDELLDKARKAIAAHTELQGKLKRWQKFSGAPPVAAAKGKAKPKGKAKSKAKA